jgi:hypothetical protein
VTTRTRFWAALVLLNLGLASGLAFLAPDEASVGTTADRVGYEYVGQHPLDPKCPHNVFCYRALVPVVLEHVPLPLSPTLRWRAFAVAANATTGVLLAAAAIGGGGPAALLASILFQTSFAATFTLFDPFTPDPAVFLAAGLLTLASLHDWPLRALGVAVVSVFAKETVTLVVSAAAVAAVLERRRVSAWVFAAAAAWLLVIGFHVLMNRVAGWSESGSGSADLAGGGWLGRWLQDPTLTTSARAFYLFIPFGFAWIYAVLGIAEAPPRLRRLVIGALVVVPGLVYVQTPERALGTACFVVVPLAALFLARPPLGFGLAAAVTNGVLTARVGLSTPWLPPVPYLLALAAIVGASAIWGSVRSSRSVAVAVHC